MNVTVNPTTTTADVIDPEIVSKQQTEACEQIVTGLRKLTGRMLLDYWHAGKLVEDVIIGSDTYGVGAMKYISMSTKHSVPELYRMSGVFTRYSEDEINQLTVAGLGITNVIEAGKIADSKERMELLLNAAATDATVKEFKAVIAEAVDSKENQKLLKAEAKEKAKESGVKSRPGTGREGSPITPVKQVGALGAKLADAFKNAIIGLKEFDPQSEKQSEVMVDAAQFAAGVLLDVLSTATGFAEVVEEYLSVNQGNARDRRGQEGRKSAYAEILIELQGFVKGYDKVLIAGEKARKDIEAEDAALKASAKEDAAKAKVAIREKAEKVKQAKAAKKAEKKVEKKEAVKPAAAKGLTNRVAELRARALKASKAKK